MVSHTITFDAIGNYYYGNGACPVVAVSASQLLLKRAAARRICNVLSRRLCMGERPMAGPCTSTSMMSCCRFGSALVTYDTEIPSYCPYYELNSDTDGGS